MHRIVVGHAAGRRAGGRAQALPQVPVLPPLAGYYFSAAVLQPAGQWWFLCRQPRPETTSSSSTPPHNLISIQTTHHTHTYSNTTFNLYISLRPPRTPSLPLTSHPLRPPSYTPPQPPSPITLSIHPVMTTNLAAIAGPSRYNQVPKIEPVSPLNSITPSPAGRDVDGPAPPLPAGGVSKPGLSVGENGEVVKVPAFLNKLYRYVDHLVWCFPCVKSRN